MSTLSKLGSSVTEWAEKGKSMLNSLMGPSTPHDIEEQLAQESDPLKRQLLEIELYIKELNDIQLLQNKTLHALKSRFVTLQQQLTAPEGEEPGAAKTEAAGSVEMEPPMEQTGAQKTGDTEVGDVKKEKVKGLKNKSH